MAPNVLMILGNPLSDSFNGGIVDAYAEAARAGGAEVRVLKLGELSFDPILRLKPSEPHLEPDLEAAQRDIAWAHHVVWVFPLWWGGQPALQRGFIDRVFMPGWAYDALPGELPTKRLLGRTARTIITMDAPKLFYRLWYGLAAHRALERATLWFCGFKVIGRRVFSPTTPSSDETRARWLTQVAEDARRDLKRLRLAPRIDPFTGEPEEMT